ncbi:MAG: cytidine deaminase [Proteobacteria bacterium]|nr:cytidine deaminase [Pseudomonadota bacterium]
MLAEQDILPLLSAAAAARNNAYAPYSRFRVGAALLAGERVIRGCNVENAAYGDSICAERGAVLAAVAAGLREFRALAVSTEASTPVPPCGSCRQVLREFCLDDFPIVMGAASGTYTVVSLNDLLPAAFTSRSLSDAGRPPWPPRPPPR